MHDEGALWYSFTGRVSRYEDKAASHPKDLDPTRLQLGHALVVPVPLKPWLASDPSELPDLQTPNPHNYSPTDVGLPGRVVSSSSAEPP